MMDQVPHQRLLLLISQPQPQKLKPLSRSSLAGRPVALPAAPASGDWSGDKPLTGTLIVEESVAGNKTYTLACNGDGGGTSVSQNVLVMESQPTEISLDAVYIATDARQQNRMRLISI